MMRGMKIYLLSPFWVIIGLILATATNNILYCVIMFLTAPQLLIGMDIQSKDFEKMWKQL